MRTSKLRSPLSLLAAGLLLGAAAGAQTSLTGTVFDGNGGPLLSGQVYHLVGNTTIPAGQTLTVQAGAIVKSGGARLVCEGTLDVSGVPGNPPVFTSLADDTAGGDTNGDGPSAGAPGDWTGIELRTGATADLRSAELRFAGQGGWAPLYLSGAATLAIEDTTIRDALFDAIFANVSGSITKLKDCRFVDNGRYPLYSASVDWLPAFSGNTASGNGAGNYYDFADHTFNGSATITKDNLIADVLVLQADTSIPAGETLTLAAGVIVKWKQGRLVGNGALVLAGNDEESVTLTSIHDDSVGGDTNLNGSATTPAAGQWSGVEVRTSGAIVADHAVLRYAGSGGWAPVYLSGAGAVTLRNTVLEHALFSGLFMNSQSVVPTIQNCRFRDNGRYPVEGLHINSLRGFHRNLASGNGVGNYAQLTVGTLLQDTRLDRLNLLNGVFVCASSVSVPAGMTLTVDAGVLIKWPGNQRVIVAGTLVLGGTECDPVALTSLTDDDYGGDTNLDGSSAGAPGSWSGIELRAGSVGRVTHATIRYAGAGGWAPVYLSGQCSGQVRDSELLEALFAGAFLGNVPSTPTFTRCSFEGNGTYAMDGAHINALPALTDNRSSGNASGDYVRVTVSSPVADVTIRRSNLLGDVLVMTSGSSVPAGVSMTLHAGIIVKVPGGRFVAAGSLNLLGTGDEPIVLTTLSDDEYGGDTNKDGPSVGTPGQWSGVQGPPGGEASLLEHVLVRFAGSGGWAGLYNSSSNLAARSYRAEHCLFSGFFVSDLAGDAENWVAFANGTNGIQATGGAFDVLHATLASNGLDGIDAAATYAGEVVNSIAWGNSGSNFDGLSASQVRFCNGSPTLAGTNGNIDVDPLFVDPSAAVGDLHLTAPSACVDTAQAATAMSVVSDHDERSRLLDPLLTGAVAGDMGAYELGSWTLRAHGEPNAGGLLKLRVSGPAGMCELWLGMLDGTSFAPPYGYVLAGTTSLLTLAQQPVGTSYALRIPRAPTLVGLEFGLQARAWPSASPAVGETTNLVRRTVLPPRVFAGPKSF